MANSLDQNQARRSLGPDFGPNCLQMISADDISRLRDYSTTIDQTISNTGSPREVWFTSDHRFGHG